MTAPVTAEESVLDAPVWESLTNAHSWLAETRGQVRRYRTDVSPFIGLPPEPTGQTWRDLAALAGSGQTIMLSGTTVAPPAEWTVLNEVPGVQFVATKDVVGLRDPQAVPLGAADAAEMLELTERTQPGPFRPKTYLLGNYWGIRQDGELVAMAGQRLNPPGWAEISAVCTDERVRGQGLATRLISTVVAGIREAGDQPFLHTAAANTAAIRLYQSLGFRLRKRTVFNAVEVP